MHFTLNMELSHMIIRVKFKGGLCYHMCMSSLRHFSDCPLTPVDAEWFWSCVHMQMMMSDDSVSCPESLLFHWCNAPNSCHVWCDDYVNSFFLSGGVPVFPVYQQRSKGVDWFVISADSGEMFWQSSQSHCDVSDGLCSFSGVSFGLVVGFSSYTSLAWSALLHLPLSILLFNDKVLCCCAGES